MGDRRRARASARSRSCIGAVALAPLAYTRFELPPIAVSGALAPSTVPPPARRTIVGWPERHEGEALSRAVQRHGEDGGLVAASMVVFDIGWTFGLLVGILDAANSYCTDFTRGFSSIGTTNCNSWPMAFIPVGGGIAAGTMNFAQGINTGRTSSTWGISFGITSSLLQTAGLIMMAVSLAGEVHDYGMLPLGDGMTLSIVPAAQFSDVGLTGVLAF